MSEGRTDEKEEKQEKQEEKDEKSFDEKWRRDPLGSMVWAGILIWLGIVLLTDNLNILPAAIDAWSLFFFGAGGILLVEVIVRYLVPTYRRPLLGTLILAIVFLAIGASNLFEAWNWGVMWAIIIIGVGLLLLFRGLGQRPKV